MNYAEKMMKMIVQFVRVFMITGIYNYVEIYKRYVAHLRHLYVYDYCREGIKETYKNFVRRCHYNGLFEKNSQTYSWKISIDDKKGFLIFSRFD